MKSFTIFMTFASLLSSAMAQMAVNDAGTQALLLKGNADYLQQMVETFKRMDEQLRTLENTLRKTEQMAQAMGDPVRALDRIGGLGQLGGVVGDSATSDLFRLGKQISSTANGAESLLHTGNNLYQAIPSSLPDGRAITRDLSRYKPFAALEAEETNFADVLTHVRTQRRRLMSDLNALLATVPKDEAEERARQTKILAIQSSLAALDADTRDASDQMTSRAEANESQRAKEAQAQQEAFSQLERDGMRSIPHPGQRQ